MIKAYIKIGKGLVFMSLLLKMCTLVNSLHNSKVYIYEGENIWLQIDPLGKVAQERSFDRAVELVDKIARLTAKR